MENPNVVAAYKKYHAKGFEIIGISLDQEARAWKKAIRDDQLTWIHVSDLKYWNNELVKLYGVQGVPQNFLIDPNGVIRKVYTQVKPNPHSEEVLAALNELK